MRANPSTVPSASLGAGSLRRATRSSLRSAQVGGLTAALVIAGALGVNSAMNHSATAAAAESSAVVAQFQRTSLVGDQVGAEDGSDLELTQHLRADATQLGCGEAALAGGEVPAGCAVKVTLSVVNVGTAPATDVVLTSDTSEGWLGLKVTSPKHSCSVTDTTVDCKLGTIGPQETVTVEFTGSTAPNATANTVSNVAQVRSAAADPTPDNNVASGSLVLTSSSDLITNQTLSTPQTAPGGSVEWIVTVVNHGPSDAANVRMFNGLDDPLLAEFTKVTLGAPADVVGTCEQLPPGGGSAACTVQTLPVGETVTMRIAGRLRSELTEVGPAVVTNAIASAETPDPVTANNTAVAQVGVGVRSAHLLIGQIPPEAAHEGEQVTWLITVSNAGPSDTPDTRLDLQVPDGLSQVLVTSDHGPCTLSGCDLGLMFASANPQEPGNTANITVTGTVTAQAPAVLSNVATVRSSLVEPNPDDTITSDVTVAVGPPPAREPEPIADLEVSDFKITPIDTYQGPGSMRRIQFTVTNHGPDPSELTWFRLTRSTDATAQLTPQMENLCMATSRELMCAVREDSTLQPGESVQVDYPISLSGIGRLGSFTDYVRVFSQALDPDESNNVAQADIEIADPETWLSVSITPLGAVPNPGSPQVPGSLRDPDGDPAFVVGGDFRYQIAIGVPNANFADATGVNVTAEFPRGFVVRTAVAESGSCTTKPTLDSEVTCRIPTISSGTTTRIVVTGKVAPNAITSAPPGDFWEEGAESTVRVQAATPGPGGRQIDIPAHTAIDVVQSTDLQLTVTPEPAGSVPKGAVGYTLAVQNAGWSDVESAAVTVMLPQGYVLDTDASNCVSPPVGELVDVAGNWALTPIVEGFDPHAPHAVVCRAGKLDEFGTRTGKISVGDSHNLRLVAHSPFGVVQAGARFLATVGSLTFDHDLTNNRAIVLTPHGQTISWKG